MRTLRLNGRLIALSQFSGETKIQRFTLADSGRLWQTLARCGEPQGGIWRDLERQREGKGRRTPGGPGDPPGLDRSRRLGPEDMTTAQIGGELNLSLCDHSKLWRY
jgi:hypothetical protein